MNATITSRATMRDVLSLAGIKEPGRDGFILCPFHVDKNPSCHLVGDKGSETGYKCFGCGARGGMCDFLVRLGYARDSAEAAKMLEEHVDGPDDLRLDTFAELRAKVKAEAGRAEDRKPIRPLGVMTDDELFAKSPEQESWLIDGLVRETGIMLLSAKPKVGKSELARNLAKAVATGTEFLGRRCRQGSVLWVGLEEPESHLRERITVMGLHGLGIQWVSQAPIGDPAEWLRQVIAKYQPALAIIDTIGRLLRIEDVNHYSDVGKATQIMLDLRAQHGTTFCAIHHNNKGDGPLGSTQWEAFCDCVMVLSRSPQGDRFVETRQRGGLPIEPVILQRDEDSGRITVGEHKSASDQRVAEQRILDYAARLGNPTTREELAKNCGRRIHLGRLAVDSLVTGGLLKVTGSGTKLDPRLYSLALRVEG